MEKYISFSVGGITFKDSLAFTQASLADLVSNLDDNQFINTRRYLEQRVHKSRVDKADVVDDDDDCLLYTSDAADE